MNRIIHIMHIRFQRQNIRFRRKERINIKVILDMKQKIFSLLVLLVAAVSGAWALDAVPAYNLSVAESDNGSGTISYTVQDMNDPEKITENAKVVNEGDLVTVTVTADEGWAVDVANVKAQAYTTWADAGARRRSAPDNIQILGDVTLTKSTTAENTWTFTMPAASVLVSAAYIPVAAFAPAEPSGTLAPTAAEGVIAGEDKAIIVAGTVANIPETTNPQGTVKYFVTDNKDMTAEQAAKANGWVETLPTAAGYTGSYADDFQVYVWYYIQAATGYADSEPQRIEVTVLSNLFDLTFKAANANTIDATQASKGTVSVKEGTGAAVNKTGDITDEGKLKAVKMGSEVKLNAKQGYKFRKVEVKKGGAAGNTYQKWDANQKELVATEIPAEVTTVANDDASVNWSAGTYVVEGDVTINGIITLSGDVDLIIKDGAKLTANNMIYGSRNKYNLRIYGQAQMTGELVVNCSNSDPIYAITTLEVHSCQVKATASSNARSGFKDIVTFNVYGGSVDGENTGTQGPGIRLADGGSMNIYGGEVKAVGKGSYYGINGNMTTLTVYGGKLWAECAENQALDSEITLTKGAGFTGNIETSADNSAWAEYTGDDTPDSKYVRVGY